MKKKWNVVALVVLLMQAFAPFVSIAEATDTTEGFRVTNADIQLDEAQNPVNMNIKITGEALTTKEETVLLDVSDNVTLTSTNGPILDEKNQEVGTYQLVEKKIMLKLNKDLQQNISLTIAGYLTNQQIKSQTITITSGTSNISKEVVMTKGENKTDNTNKTNKNESPSPNKESNTTDTTKDIPKESTSTIPDVKRGPIDIATILPSQSGETSIITGMKVVDKNGNPVTSGKIGDYFKFNVDLAIPEDIRTQMQAGDYAQFQLPDEIKITQNQTFNLLDEDGEVYATVKVTTDGKVVITFNEKIAEESDVKGNFNFEGQFDKDNIDGAGDKHINLPFVDKQGGIDITIKPEVDSSVEKQGAFDKTPNPEKVIWNVDVNKAMDEITHATVTENFPAGLTYEGVKVYSVDVDLDGNVISGSEKLVDPSEYTVDAKGNVTFKNKIKSVYRLTYDSSIDEKEKPGAKGGKVKFENKVTFDGDEIDPIPASSTVTADYKKALEKGQPGYDPKNQTFNWTIQYNYNEAKIKESQATITDSINSSMDLVSDSVVVNKVTFDAKGNPVEGAALVEGKEYTLVPKANGKGFDMKFIGDVDYAVAIHYTTKVTGELDTDKDFNNSVEDGSGNKDSENGHAKQQGLVKKVDHVDNNAKIIEWSIDVNKNNYEMQNWNLTDQLSKGLTLDESSFVINDTTTGKSLVKGVDYTLDYDKTTNEFDVVFLKPYVLTSDTFSIHYQTKYNADLVPKEGAFKNDASSDWTSTTDNTHKNPKDSAKFVPNDETNGNGFKYGNYNAVDKKITWTLGVNYNRVPLKDAYVTDPMTGNQKFVPGSLKAFHYKITKDGKYIKGAEVTGAELATYEVTEPTSDNNVLSIHLPDGPSTSQYMFEYQTSLEGEVINDSSTYTNTASTTNSGSPDYTVTGKVSIAHGGSIAEKSGAQDADGFVNWSVNINPSQSTISDVVVHDNPSTNQVIDEKSIVVYETKVASDGTITKGAALDPSKYQVVLTTDSKTGLQHLQVSFDGDLTTSYVLQYRSMVFIESGNTGKVSNDLTVTGNNHGIISGGDSSDISVVITDGGGTVSGTKGSLTIHKENSKKESLTGAKFELWDSKNIQKLREGQVDNNGKLIFGSLPYGSYLLKEVQAPTGYSIPDDLVTGRKVTVSKATTDAGVLTDIVDPESAVTLIKEAASKAPLSGATFKLERLVGSIWTPIRTNETLRTDATGKLVVKGLDEGHYRFSETKAPLTPKEYILNTTPIEFDVSRNTNGQIKPITVGPFFNYLGSAVFEKQDADGNPLANAAFTVKRVKDGLGKAINETVATNVKSDRQGKVNLTNLSPGVYEVTETKAPTGYVLNTDKLTFTIVSQASGAVTTVKGGILKNYKGTMSFVKKNDKNEALPGAMF